MTMTTHIPGLAEPPIDIAFPDRLKIAGKVAGNEILALDAAKHPGSVQLSAYARRVTKGFIATGHRAQTIFVTARPTSANVAADAILLITDADTVAKIREPQLQAAAKWLKPKPTAPQDITVDDGERMCREIVGSWTGQFRFQQDGELDDGSKVAGLRQPQIGALYAVLAHWSVSNSAATVVMPTGTGKTETMLALLVATKIQRLLVIVPTNALRDQIARKFLTLGKLADLQCVPEDVKLPVVAKLTHRPNSTEEVDDIFRRANVIVTTMQVAGQCASDVQEQMASLCSHLFIDEAHHIAARTWSEFKRKFESKSILQFTATPFRTDGKRIDGKFIYNYPLAKAQNEGYFRPITFRSVVEFDPTRADRSTAGRAAEQLRSDLEQDLDHVLMARADTTDRADSLLELYRELLPEMNPVVIHNKIPAGERRNRQEALRDRSSRVVICVDMFGEGFDFPQLKVAALHDRHKSLAITLQFIGRFTRDLASVGNATVVANIADDSISNALRTLYAEDADWNFLLTVLSEAATGRARRRAEVLEGFAEPLLEIPLQTLFPKMTAVVYKTQCEEWEPHKIEDVIPGTTLYAGPIVNPHYKLAIYVTRDEEFVHWGSIKQIQNVEWNLHVLHWNSDLGLLFINSSDKEFHEPVAKAVANTEERIYGEPIYRSLGGVKRLTLTNLGLSHALGKNIRYTMFMGADIADGLTEAQRVNRRKSNLFGLGYEDDEKVTIGCSSKGRLWSHRVAYDLGEWTEWCAHVGRKLLDPSISVESILAHVIKARRVSERPSLVPVMVSWPEGFLSQPEDRIDLQIGTVQAPFYESELDVGSYDDHGPLTFEVIVGGRQATFTIELSEDSARYRQTAGERVLVTIRRQSKALEEYFNDDPPIIHFANGDFLLFNELFELPRGAARVAFDPENVLTWNWDGIDLTHESQGDEKDPTSIQRRVIESVLAGEFGDFDVVFDDDGSGEVADVVAVRRNEREISATLFHCKFSKRPAAGRRIDDLYAVCGQAQKCVHWREDPRRLLRHLLHREGLRQSAGRPSRFEKGTTQDVQQIINASRELPFKCDVVVVQPGLSKAQMEAAQRDVLGATETFLQETFSISLRVIASP